MPDHKKIALFAPLYMLLLTTLVGCAGLVGRGPMAGTYEGPPQKLGQGTARAFVVLDAGGKPSAMGVKLTEAALTGLPTEPPKEYGGWDYVLALPKEAAVTGYTHVFFLWNPKGHIPPGIYDVPHFDFHFYLTSSDERERITVTEEDLAKARKQPPADYMPAGYALPPGTEEPRMGAHAINPASDEFNKKPFTKTFIYGFYNGQMTFVEPMVTKAFLETKPNFTEPVKLPKAYPRAGYYPTQYSVKYDPGSKEYRVSIEGLTEK